MRRDYTFSLPKILAALVEQARGRYVATVPYPEWMKNDVEEVKERRPVGRPRKHLKVLIEGKVGRRTPTDQGCRVRDQAAADPQSGNQAQPDPFGDG